MCTVVHQVSHFAPYPKSLLVFSLIKIYTSQFYFNRISLFSLFDLAQQILSTFKGIVYLHAADYSTLIPVMQSYFSGRWKEELFIALCVDGTDFL